MTQKKNDENIKAKGELHAEKAKYELSDGNSTRWWVVPPKDGARTE